jgi:hypothetical protein
MNLRLCGKALDPNGSTRAEQVDRPSEYEGWPRTLGVLGLYPDDSAAVFDIESVPLLTRKVMVWARNLLAPGRTEPTLTGRRL